MELSKSYNLLLLSVPQPVHIADFEVSGENLVDESKVASIKQEFGTQQLWNFHKCNMCCYKTKSSYFISRHLKRHRVTKSSKVFNCLRGGLEYFRCNKCKYKSSLMISFNKHIVENHCVFVENGKTNVTPLVDEGAAMKLLWKNLGKSYDCDKCSFTTFSQLLYVVHSRNCPVRNFLKKASEARRLKNKQLIDRFQSGNKSIQEKTPLPSPALKITNTKLNWCKDQASQNDSDFDEDYGSDIQPLPPPPMPKLFETQKSYNPQSGNEFEDFESDEDSSKIEFSPSFHMKNETIRHESACTQLDFSENFETNLESKATKKLRNKQKENRREFKSKGFQCTLCEFSSTFLAVYQNHLNSKHDADTAWLYCGMCDYKTVFPLSLRNHRARLRHHIPETSNNEEHNGAVTTFKCDLCNFQTSKDSYLMNHILEKHVVEEQVVCYECQVCTFKTICKNELGEHIMKKHIDPQHNEWFTCEMCTSKFKQRLDLKKHIFTKHIM